MSYYNPFQNLELRIPDNLRDEVDRFCQTQPLGGSKPSPNDSPFQRQVDLWFMALCIGANKEPKNNVGKWHRFMTGEILSRNPERIELLELLVISYTNNPWIIDDPSEVIKLANQLAAAGLPELLSMINNGNAKPIWNLTDSLLELLDI